MVNVSTTMFYIDISTEHNEVHHFSLKTEADPDHKRNSYLCLRTEKRREEKSEHKQEAGAWKYQKRQSSH